MSPQDELERFKSVQEMNAHLGVCCPGEDEYSGHEAVRVVVRPVVHYLQPKARGAYRRPFILQLDRDGAVGVLHEGRQLRS